MVRRYEIPLAAVAMAVALTAMACRGGESPPQARQPPPGVSDNGDTSTRPVPTISLQQPGGMKEPDVR